MNIIVGYSGTATSKKVIELAKKHAKAFNAVVTIFISDSSHVDEKSSVKAAERFWTGYKEAEAEGERLKSEFKEESITCVTQFSAKGVDPGTDILDYAREIEADEIIIGIEKKSKVGKLLFGSTAQKVILEAECPVVTIK